VALTLATTPPNVGRLQWRERAASWTSFHRAGVTACRTWAEISRRTEAPSAETCGRMSTLGPVGIFSPVAVVTALPTLTDA